MGKFTAILSVGDVRSDGLANEVVRLIVATPHLLPDLLQELKAHSPSVRAHAADALEKVARTLPEVVGTHVSALVSLAKTDDVPMVRWHLAMVMEHVCRSRESAARVVPALCLLLGDPSPFVRSWAVSGLAVIAQRGLAKTPRIVRAISPLTRDPSTAVAKRARTAVHALTDPSFRLPPSWEKVRG